MNDPYAYLQEQQECSSPSGSIMETSYASSDDGMSPWSGLSSIARHVASSVSRSAKSLINELAELEYEARGGGSHFYDDSEGGSESGGGGRGEEGRGSTSDNDSTTVLPLPWEICFQSTDEKLKISIVQKEDEPLKEKILALSTDESVFTGPFNEKNSNEDDSIFSLDDSRVMLIRRLLEIDSNLGYIHAKVSGELVRREQVPHVFFWIFVWSWVPLKITFNCRTTDINFLFDYFYLLTSTSTYFHFGPFHFFACKCCDEKHKQNLLLPYYTIH